MDVLSPFSLSSDILIDSPTESPVHVLMLSIQAVRGLPRLRASGIVPCIISFSRQLPCFLIMRNTVTAGAMTRTHLLYGSGFRPGTQDL